MNKDKALEQLARNLKSVAPPSALNHRIMHRMAVEKKRTAFRTELLSNLLATAGSVAIILIVSAMFDRLFFINIGDALVTAWHQVVASITGFSFTMPVKLSLFIAAAALFLLYLDYKFRQRYEQRHSNRELEQ